MCSSIFPLKFWGRDGFLNHCLKSLEHLAKSFKKMPTMIQRGIDNLSYSLSLVGLQLPRTTRRRTTGWHHRGWVTDWARPRVVNRGCRYSRRPLGCGGGFYHISIGHLSTCIISSVPASPDWLMDGNLLVHNVREMESGGLVENMQNIFNAQNANFQWLK